MSPYFRAPFEGIMTMYEHRRDARIGSAQINVLYTAEGLASVLVEKRGFRMTCDEAAYLRYLCGKVDHEPNMLTPQQKAVVGNLFEEACNKRRRYIDRLPERDRHKALPGLHAVPRNRELVRQQQSEAGRARRAERKRRS